MNQLRYRNETKNDRLEINMAPYLDCSARRPQTPPLSPRLSLIVPSSDTRIRRRRVIHPLDDSLSNAR